MPNYALENDNEKTKNLQSKTIENTLNFVYDKREKKKNWFTIDTW